MKQYKSISLVLLAILGCQSEINRDDYTNDNVIPMSFYASIEMPQDTCLTKTVLDGVPSDAFRNVLWECQDEVYVTTGTTSTKFVNTTEGISDVALLEGELPIAADYYAAYPYDMVTKYSASGFKMELPSVQTYSPDGVSSGSFPMVAQCDGGVFSFKNLCGIFVLRLTGDETISSVTFSGKDASGKCISVAGNGTVSMDYSGNPSLIMEDSAVTSVTLKSSEGVRLTPTQPTTFHIVLPVGTYTTFTVIIKATDGTVMTVESKKALEIKRSKRTTAAAILYSGIIHYQDLNESGKTANCYIVSSPGYYKFKTCKGNSTDSVGEVNSVEVLWESFGTDVTPSVGDLVKAVSYKDDYIQFSTPPTSKEGNAVIAAMDASGTILWSWHIWLTDKPEEQVYYNNAGTMMDRNLGAISATPGDVGALGLLYQWGRKDPFLGSSSISENIVAESTYSWPSSVSRQRSIEYAIKHPTTYIYSDKTYNADWYYVSKNSVDTTRWQSIKTIYDPCPIGWRVPDGGENSIWKKGYNKPASLGDKFDSINKGVDFSGLLGGSETIWYPATGYRAYDTGTLYNVGKKAFYDSVNISHIYGWGIWSLEIFDYYNPGFALQDNDSSPAGGGPIRCFKEDPSSETPSDPVVPAYEDLSASGSANSYIISASGDYKFKAVKGNSSESVGSVSSVEVLWESFGTDLTPSVGDLIRNASYSDDYIQFSTPATLEEGNAVIAAKNSAGTILWSWHIWLTDQPEEQVYYNNAGIMMDRNLGATSATPGDVGALGLLYQWGRKDPFLGSSDISSDAVAKSIGTWPSAVSASTSKGTVEYATENPMTFIEGTSSSESDWHYSSRNNDLWKSSKTIYDPCPAGWRVPDGGINGVWSKACSSSSSFSGYTYDSSDEGMNFSGKFGSDQTIWYPASGCRLDSIGSLLSVSSYGGYWSVTPIGGYASSHLSLNDSGYVNPSSGNYRARGLSVRCVKE